MKKKRLLSCVLIVALLLSLCAIGVGAATVDDFTDVSPDDWYYDAVSEVAAAGYFNGTTTTTFDPQLTMTRAMFVTVLARFDGATVDNSADTGFADVPTGQYYTGAVAWAAENGLVQGYGGNAFGTSNPITRQDMAVLMTRYIAYYEAKNSVAATTSAKGSETTHDVVDDPADFADAASIAAYATEAVVECANYGLLIGDDNGNFRPTASATRAEAAAVISRLSWTVKETDKVTATGGGSSHSSSNDDTDDTTNDKIGAGVAAAMELFEEALETGIKTFSNTPIVDADGVSATTYGDVGSVTPSDNAETYVDTYSSESWYIGKEDGPNTTNDIRTVTLDLTVSTGDTGSLTGIAAFAIDVAKYIVVDGALSNEMLSNVIDGVVDGVKEATKLNISTNRSDLTASIKEALHDQGGSFWTKSGIGEYVSAAAVTIEDALGYDSELKLEVADGAVSLDTTNGTLTAQLTGCATALAVQMFADLQANLKDTAQDYITVSPRFTVEFTLNEANKEALSAFATKYEVVSNVTFNSNDTVLFSRTGHYDFSIALNMANDTLTKKYESGFDSLLTSNRLKNLLNGYVASMIATEITNGSSSVISALNEILATAEEDSGTVSTAVTDAVTEWFVTNATSGSTETDNSAIYSLVDTLAEATLESTVDISTTLTDHGVSDEDAAVITAYVKAYQDAYTAAAKGGTTLTEADIEDIKTQVATTTGDVDATIDALIEAYLSSNDGSSAVAAIMVDADEFSAPVMLADEGDDTAIVSKVMATLKQLAEVDKMQDVPVSDLVSILSVEGLFDTYNGTVKTMVERLSTAIDNLTAMLPATVGEMVTVNSIKINETVVKDGVMDKLANIDTVEEFADLLNTVANDYAGGDLTVGDLKVVVNLTVGSVESNITLYVNYDKDLARVIYNSIDE